MLIATNFLITWPGRYRWAVWFGHCLTVVAAALLTLLDEATQTRHWAPILAFVGVGQGAITVSILISIQVALSQQHIVYPTATYMFLRSFGLCLGVAVSGTIFQKFMTKHLNNLGLPEEIAGNSEAFVVVIKGMPIGSSLRNAYISAYAASFRSFWSVSLFPRSAFDHYLMVLRLTCALLPHSKSRGKNTR